MKWAQERDLLIAQTMTFVQSITGKKPGAETRTQARVEAASIDQIGSAERPVADVREVVPPARVSARSGLHEEIQGRVAAFRAHQQRFERERDAYCDAVVSKLRASIASQPTPRRVNDRGDRLDV